MNVNCEELISKVKEFGGLMEKSKNRLMIFRSSLKTLSQMQIKSLSGWTTVKNFTKSYVITENL